MCSNQIIFAGVSKIVPSSTPNLETPKNARTFNITYHAAGKVKKAGVDVEYKECSDLIRTVIVD